MSLPRHRDCEIPAIERRSRSKPAWIRIFLDTTTLFLATTGCTLAGIGAGTTTIDAERDRKTRGTLSTHDTEIGVAMQQITWADGAALEFHLSGTPASDDQIVLAGLAANGVIELPLNNLGGEALQTDFSLP